PTTCRKQIQVATNRCRGMGLRALRAPLRPFVNRRMPRRSALTRSARVSDPAVPPTEGLPPPASILTILGDYLQIRCSLNRLNFCAHGQNQDVPAIRRTRNTEETPSGAS